jgi:hypothetical protein
MKNLVIKNGDVGLVRQHFQIWRPMSWLTAIIRLMTGSRYNHAQLFLTIQGELFVIEAVKSGVRMCSYERWVKKYPHDLKVIRFTDYQGLIDDGDIRLRAMEHLGKPYDYAALFFHQLAFQVYRWFGVDRWLGKKSLDASKHVYCSELVAYVYDIARWWTLTPADLDQIDHETVLTSTKK